MGRKIPHLEAGTMNCPLAKMNNLMWPQACHLNSLLYCLILADWGKKISPDDLYLKSNHAHVIKQNKARNCKMQKRIKTMTEVTHKIHNFTCPERLMLTWWTTSFCSFALFFFFFNNWNHWYTQFWFIYYILNTIGSKMCCPPQKRPGTNGKADHAFE